MSKKRVERRLAAIVAVDVAGYSRLMSSDEEGTLARFHEHRQELFDPKIDEHRGRIVKTTGDGILIEFASVVDALRCAVEVQRAMGERNSSIAVDRRIEFRVGIHMGDIIVEDGDIFGEGVNIASRLEGLANPGGICVSARVQEDTAGKFDLASEDIGEQTLKNIPRPIRTYRVETRPSRISQIPVATKPPRLSIVVLPFANLSNDPDQEYFVYAITDDVTTDLSRIEGSFVIARSTAFSYKSKAVEVKQIGRDLGVHYVLEGSIRRLGEQLQIKR